MKFKIKIFKIMMIFIYLPVHESKHCKCLRNSDGNYMTLKLFMIDCTMSVINPWP